MQLLGRITLNVLAHDTQPRWCGLQRDLLGLLKPLQQRDLPGALSQLSLGIPLDGAPTRPVIAIVPLTLLCLSLCL
jgi:hypothetical protein